jgi:hypothetical protein
MGGGCRRISTAFRTGPMPRSPLLLFVALLGTVTLGACAFHTSRTSIVVITDSKSVVEPCTKLGEINGDSTLGAILLTDKARDTAIARLKIRGAELGGTHVFSTVADIKWKGPDTAGTVYKCGA